jgi:peptidoglycan/xylan/chitin deacetylase (PgdA/CDA1 family)
MALAFVLALPVGPGWAEAEEDWGAAVLVYHRFGEHKYPSTNTTLDQLKAHLAELSDPRYRVVPLPEIVEALRGGGAPRDRAVAITVDDAYRSVYEAAWPLLREAGLPFTLFVSTDLIDQGATDLMTWAQLAELAQSPLVTIGNHSASHLHLPEHPGEEAVADILRAQNRLEQELGFAPAIFAYPFGELSLDLKSVVRELGFVAGFGQYSGAIGPTSDLYELPRFAMNEEFGDLERLRIAASSLPLPVEDLMPEDPFLKPLANPPLAGFTLRPGVGDPSSLACYSNAKGLRVERLGRRVELRFAGPLAPGRTRVNCTLPAGDGRWRWLGRQFLVAE